MQDQQQLHRKLMDFKKTLPVEQQPSEDAATDQQTPSEAEPKPKPKDRRTTSPHMALDKFLQISREQVAANYNEHRRPETRTSGDLLPSDIIVISCAKVLGNWKAQFSSLKSRGLLWEVSLHGIRQELYIDVFSKINTTRIALGEDSAQ